jgi:tetratricopeptide (TPR) repeat protein
MLRISWRWFFAVLFLCALNAWPQETERLSTPAEDVAKQTSDSPAVAKPSTTPPTQEEIRKLVAAGKVDEAFAACELEGSGTQIKACYRDLMAEILSAKGTGPEVLKFAEDWVRSNPNSANAYYLLGWLDNQMSQPDRALPELQKALALDPAHPFAHFDLGVSYHVKKNFAEAEKNYREAIARDPDYAEAYANLCDLYIDMKAYEKAAETCETGLKQNPDLPAALNNAAWFYATSEDQRFRNPSKALQYASKAVDLSGGKEPAILNTLAEAYFVNGDFDRAIKTEKKAIAMRDKSSYRVTLKKYEEAKKAKQH